jgi:hypothetical protein
MEGGWWSCREGGLLGQEDRTGKNSVRSEQFVTELHSVNLFYILVP